MSQVRLTICLSEAQSPPLPWVILLQGMADDTMLLALIGILDHMEGEDGHAMRVSKYARIIAQELGLGKQDIISISHGASLHDIGKIGIPTRILRKNGSLTEDEWITVRRHPDIGFGLLQRFPGLRHASLIVLQHHERWDGKGYPAGLSGDSIIIGARIFAIADTMDAILSDRPYRPARPYDVVLEEVTANSGKQFDPHIVEIFQKIKPEMFI